MDKNLRNDRSKERKVGESTANEDLAQFDSRQKHNPDQNKTRALDREKSENKNFSNQKPKNNKNFNNVNSLQSETFGNDGNYVSQEIDFTQHNDIFPDMKFTNDESIKIPASQQVRGKDRREIEAKQNSDYDQFESKLPQINSNKNKGFKFDFDDEQDHNQSLKQESSKDHNDRDIGNIIDI